MEHQNVLKVFEYIVDADTEHVYIITECVVWPLLDSQRHET